MYLRLLAGVSLAALTVPLSAETVVDAKRSSPLRTSQLRGGAGDSVRVTRDGSIELTTGSAIVVDTDHAAANEGKIVVTNADGASGIEVTGDRRGGIVNTGSITVDETYLPSDIDNDKDLDGPFAVGRDRAGIRVRGSLTGDISHSGSITIEGNQSAGLSVDGTLAGRLVHDGKTSVTGDGSTGVAVRAVTGDVRLAGAVSVAGAGAVGARFAGDLGGALVVQGDIAATGYRYVSGAPDVTKLDADDLLQGGSALVVEGDVAKGIHFAIAPKDTNKDDPDEDKDGIDDAKEGNARVRSFGAAPAVVIGSADRDIRLGSVPATGSGFSLIVDGEISGHGVYAGVDGNGLAIGGRGGGVIVEKGIGVAGTVSATSLDASATALRLGSGASTPELRNSGSILASGGKTPASHATGVLVDAGGTLPLLRNSGIIRALVSGEEGSAAAVVDRSGTLRSIENSGKIIASGAKAGTGRNIAIDLTSVTSGATVRQTSVAAGIDSPLIEGDVLFGTGDDVLEVAGGKLVGRVAFGSGLDRLTLSGGARLEGRLDFGGQADVMSLAGSSLFAGQADFAGGAGRVVISDKASFVGRLAGAERVAVDLAGGTLDLAGTTRLGTLSVGAAGTIVATLSRDPASATSITVSGAASFEKGSRLKLRLTDLANATGSYEVLRAGSLSGAANLEPDSALVPFMYKGVLAVDQAASVIKVDIARKATSELGLNRSQAAAYDPLYAALAKDKDIAGVFLEITEKAAFHASVARTLPDHAGGAFDGISLGIRSFARSLSLPQGPIERSGKLRIVADFAGWDSTKSETDSARYDLDGMGFSGGLELDTGVGQLGISATWLWNRHDTAPENAVLSDTYEAAAFWRGTWGAFSGFARGSYGRSDFSGTRYFAGSSGGKQVERHVRSQWSGNVASLMGGVAIEGGSRYFFFRPSISFDYVSLGEDGYAEQGGGKALDLVVEARESDELGANLAVASGFDLLGMGGRDETWLRIEAEGGWREVLAGELGATSARFDGGETFTLAADPRMSGWFARLRGMGGDAFYLLSAEVSAERRNDRTGYGLSASVRFAF